MNICLLVEVSYEYESEDFSVSGPLNLTGKTMLIDFTLLDTDLMVTRRYQTAVVPRGVDPYRRFGTLTERPLEVNDRLRAMRDELTRILEEDGR